MTRHSGKHGRYCFKVALRKEKKSNTFKYFQSNPVTSISEKDRARIVNTLLKVKLQGMAIQLASLLERNFALFSGNF